MYKDFQRPLYRGVKPGNIELKSYRINEIHFWPGFSSTTKDEKFALNRSRDGIEEN
jgi:hypothetical protein